MEQATPTNGHSAKKVSGALASEISAALESVQGWGSVEIIIQDNKVTQITHRSIKKTAHSIDTIGEVVGS